MKCGLFPLRAKFALLKKTKQMHRAIAELRGLALKAAKSVRHEDDAFEGIAKGETKSRQIFEILDEYAVMGPLTAPALTDGTGKQNLTESLHSPPRSFVTTMVCLHAPYQTTEH